MQLRAFKQVDVFTAQPYYGNPLGVVLDGTAMARAGMWIGGASVTCIDGKVTL